MVHLKSFTSLSSDPVEKTRYLDISEYDQNDKMHIAIVVISGVIDKNIHYGFSDNSTISTNLLTYTIDTTSSEYFCTSSKSRKSKSKCGHRYYFDIKKTENAKYLLIKCTGFTGSSISFDFMPMSSIGFYILYAVIFIVCIAGFCIYLNYHKRKERVDNKLLEQKTDLVPMIPEDNQPSYNNYQGNI
jgi:hypothetical protein